MITVYIQPHSLKDLVTLCGETFHRFLLALMVSRQRPRSLRSFSVTQ